MNPVGMSSAGGASHPDDTEGDFQLATWQSYIKGLRNFWRTEAYQAVVSTVDGTLQPTELERRYADLAAYRLYAWLERYSQQMKYYGRRGLVDLACDQKQHCSELLDEAKNKGPGRVEIDADFEVPSYVRESHTHQHVGGVWSNPAAAFAYEASTSGFSFALGESSAPMRVYADAASALANMAQHPVGKVIDIGCAIGESTRA